MRRKRISAPLWQEAAAFAARAHEHEVRKDGVTPYISHPMRVALTCACVFGVTDETVLAAALLHDTIEDTGCDYDEVLEGFGKSVADIVACLTKDMRLVESKREVEYDRQLAEGPWQARLIKLADVYDNLSDAKTAEALKKLIGKARRAIKLAEGEERLAGARATVMRLVQGLKARGTR